MYREEGTAGKEKAKYIIRVSLEKRKEGEEGSEHLLTFRRK